MRYTADHLHNLLPSIYRVRDAEHGYALKALLAVIAEQAGVVEDDIARLHENWFIETCDEWVVPYIGDLLGVRGLHELGAAGFSQRARVANTIRYRRRKGTATMLEQLARDVTQWPARAVEFFQLLATTQHLNHVRLGNVRTPDLRDTDELELLEGPFESAAHTAEARSIASSRGRYNIPNVGLFLWRLQSYPVTRSTARPVGKPSDGRFTFSPLGHSQPLFNRPRTETEITHLAEEINVPGPLRRRPLYEELNARRRALEQGTRPDEEYFGSDRPVLEVFQEGSSEPLSPEELVICHLGWEEKIVIDGEEKDWEPPEPSAFTPKDGQPSTTKVAVDPALGRLVYLKGIQPKEPLLVSYSYGFSADVGGGPYDRRGSIPSSFLDEEQVDWQRGVTQEIPTVPDELVDTLTKALEDWNTLAEAIEEGKVEPGKVGVIAVMDSRTYEEEGLPVIKVPEGSQLLIVAAHWPEVEDENGKRRVKGRIVPNDLRPHVLGNLKVKGTLLDEGLRLGELFVNGIWLEGQLSVYSGDLGKLDIVHSTLVPDKGGLSVTAGNSHLHIHIERTICRPISVSADVPALRILESLVDPGSGPSALMTLGAKPSGTQVQLEASTVLGTVEARSLEAGNSIFTGKVRVVQRQEGCVRFCYVPPGSVTPRQFRCQPDLALAQRAKELGAKSADDLTAAERARVQLQVSPVFASTRYGDPAYAQLSLLGPPEIRTGAEDGSEMGVFRHLKQPQREANLRASLDEYLRVGLDAGIFYVT